MKKVLILTYYWPPGGGAGVQRWLKFVKYLRRFGWEPVVYTPENPESPTRDPSLAKDIPDGISILKRKIWEPYTLYRKFLGQDPNEKIQAGFLSEKEKPRKKQSLSVWIRGNLFIPDARKYWIRPSVRYLSAYLDQHPVDALVSSGPPHSLHLIALKLKEKHHIPWLADFRDPWTTIDFYDKLRLGPRADRKHHLLEEQVVRQANAVVTISHDLKESFKKYRQEGVHVITNGYDPDDLPEKPAGIPEEFVITHLGSLNADRNPKSFWKVIRELVDQDPLIREKLKVRLIGKTDYSVRESIREHGLGSRVECLEAVPHDRVFAELHNSRLLLLPVNDTAHAAGIITGKVFEYLASGRPILGIGPEKGELARILQETGTGVMCGFNNEEKIRAELLRMIETTPGSIPGPHQKAIEAYSRIRLTEKLSGILDQIHSHP